MFITSALTKTVTIDAAAPAANLTVSNLTIRGVGSSTNTLELTGAVDRLLVRKSLLVGTNAVATVTNAVLQVSDPAAGSNIIDGAMNVLAGGAVTNAVSDTTVGGTAGAGGSLTVDGGSFFVGADQGARLTVGKAANSTGTVLVTAGSLVATNLDNVIGESGVGQVTVSGGILLLKPTFLAQFAGSQGTLTVAGGTNIFIGSTFTFPLRVGESANSTGAVWVTGGSLVATNASTEIIIGNFGVGQFTVSNSICRADRVTVCNNAGSHGTLTVAGGTLLVNPLTIGRGADSQGTLTLSGGMLLSTGSIIVGAGGTGTVWMTDGQLIVTNQSTTIGSSLVGQMTVSNGTVRVANLSVGSGAGSQGTLTLAGGTIEPKLAMAVGSGANSTGAVWVTGGLLAATNQVMGIGNFGVGEMTISNGMAQAQSVFVGRFGGAQGTLTVAGGTNTASSLVIGTANCSATGVVNVVGGQLVVTNITGTAVLDVRSGTLSLSAGTLVANNLIITNACGRFVRSGGVLTKDQLILDPDLDADGDGLSNGWEQQFGLDPLVATGDDGAAGDPDGDGVTNMQEFLDGTDPVEFRITSITREGNDIRVTWKTFGDNTYFVQTNSVGMTGSFTNDFTNLSPPIVIPFGAPAGTTNFLHIGGATNVPALYYRGRLVP